MKTTTFFCVLITISFLMACNSNKMERADSGSSADSVSTAFTPMMPDSVKLVKTAGIDFKVKDVYKSSRLISEKARFMGGMVTHQNIESVQKKEKSMRISGDSVLTVSAYTTQADLIVKVPSSQLEEFMQEVSSIATFVYSSKLDIDDKSIDYLASSLKQKSRQELLSLAKKKTIKSNEAASLIDKEDERIDQIINNKRIDTDVRYSSIQLNLSQPPVIRKEIVANEELSAYNLPFFHRLGNALVNGWELFLSLIIGVTNLWMLIILGLVSWFAFRLYKQKRKDLEALNH